MSVTVFARTLAAALALDRLGRRQQPTAVQAASPATVTHTAPSDPYRPNRLQGRGLLPG